MTDALNHTWSMGYDSQGNVTSKTDPLNNTFTITYDGIGRRLSMSDPLGRTSLMTYDAMSRVISQTDPANANTTFTYDQNGNKTAMTNALNNTWTMQYDAKNRLISKKFPLTPSDNGVQREVRLEYNKNDELTAAISPSGRTTRYTFDNRGQRKTMMDPLDGTVAYDYDINQNLISLQDQRNNTTRFDYDELYRVIKVTDPVGKFTTISYDAEGNMISQIDRLNRTTNIAYDVLDRPINIQYVDATVTWQYDAVGRKTRVDDTQFGGSFISWTYDNANRLLTETTPQGTVSYTYNQANERTSMTALTRPSVNYTYDNAGRLSTISQNLGQGLETFTYNYDILSRRTTLQTPNGVNTSYEYDQDNRLARLKHQKGTNPSVEDLQYTYNADDEINSISSLYSTQKLPTADKIANTADANNRINQFNSTNYQFNNLGETTAKIDTDGTTQYQWDQRGRLIGVVLPNNQQVSYKYDGLNRRINRITTGESTSFVYDIDNIVIDVNGGSQIDYINGLGIDEKLRQFSSSTNSIYFIPNHLRSTVALTDNSGQVVERIQYEAFGKSTDNNLTRFTYTGREKESLTGLSYYRNRWYDPNQGRFLVEDKLNSITPLLLNSFTSNEIFNIPALGDFRQMDLYTYVGNNPIGYIDSYGLQIDDRATRGCYCQSATRNYPERLVGPISQKCKDCLSTCLKANFQGSASVGALADVLIARIVQLIVSGAGIELAASTVISGGIALIVTTVGITLHFTLDGYKSCAKASCLNTNICISCEYEAYKPLWFF